MDSPASSSSHITSTTATTTPTSSSAVVACVSKGDRKPIKLYSPYGAPPILFPWQKEYEKTGAMDIYDTIRQVFGLIPEIKEKLEKLDLFREAQINNYEWIRSISKKFNKVANAYFKEHSKNGEAIKEDYASSDLLRTICTRAYNRAVDDEKKLNRHYEAFSSQTYGETSYDRLRSIIEEIEITESDFFVDLGSGVGQLVVQMAGGSKVKRACGIEIADLPSDFAKKLEIEFKGMMKWFGRKYRPFQIHHGDFLDEKFRSLIVNEATIIFINNYAFQADLESKIKSKLLSELKHGTRIISTKPYAPANKKNQITQRTLGDLSSILDVVEFKKIANPCSWTSNDVPYYLHVINRVKLAKFFEEKNDPALRFERSGTPSSNSSSFSREQSRVPSRNGTSNHKNGDAYGPTTRRKWNQIVNEMESTKKGSETPNENNHSELDFRSSTPIVDAAKTRDENIADIIASVAGGMSQQIPKEFSSPTKKRPRKDTIDGGKVTVRGRPRKNTQPIEKRARISQEAREGMDIMHQLTSEACNKAAEIFADSSFVITDVNNPALKATTTTLTPKIEIDSGSQGQQQEYPNLDRFITELRSLYIKFLDSFQTEEFYQSLRARREREKLESQNQQITEEGVSLFKSTLKSYGVDLEKQRDKLTSAKRFIARYNNVVGLVHSLEKEMAALDEESKSIIIQYSRECANEMSTSSSTAQNTSSQNISTLMEHHQPQPQQHPQQPPPPAPTQPALNNPKLEDFIQSSSSLPQNAVAMALQQSLKNFPQSIGTNDIPLDQLLINNIAQTLTQNPMLNSPLFSNPGLLQPLTNPDSQNQQQSSTTNMLNSYLNLPPDLLNLIKNGNLATSLSTDSGSLLNLQNHNQIYNNNNNNNTDNSRASTTPIIPTPSEVLAAASSMAQNMPTMSTANTILNNMPSTSKEQQQQQIPIDPIVNGTSTTTTTAPTTSSSSSSSKKPRTRSVRIPSTKKTAPPKSVEDPAKEEEIESKVKNFVQIALEVDKTAKSNAEKDRKVRTSEKRSKEKSGTEQGSSTFESSAPKSTEESPASASGGASGGSGNKSKNGSRKNKTYPTINMTSPSSTQTASKKRSSSDISSLPTSSTTIVVSTPSSMSTRPIVVASSNSIVASSPLYQQMLTPNSVAAPVTIQTSTNPPMFDTTSQDFLHLLSQNALKETDAMQMLMRNMNGGNNHQLLNLINGLSSFQNVVSSSTAASSAAAVAASMGSNSTNNVLQNYILQMQNGAAAASLQQQQQQPSDNNTTSSTSTLPQPSDIGQF
jgi:H3 lysine-79-specific histone-lysine N-methyltransferase